MRILPYREAEDEVAGVVLTFVDITERKRGEERLSGMVEELNHRVKNSLAGVQSLVYQTASSAGSIDEFARTLFGRIHAMGTTHSVISETNWAHADLRRLAESVLQPFTEEGTDHLRIEGPTVSLRSSVAVVLGMIVYELATNAVKYGVHWTETGGPPVKPPAHRGFGTEFIRQSVEFELKGNCVFDYRPAGLACSFTLPLGEVAIASSEVAEG
jgi:two-component system CheB/CheR fusion protein